MNVSIYYKTPTILLDNIAAIIFQKTISLFLALFSTGLWQVFAIATD